jgi:transposase-like protein
VQAKAITCPRCPARNVKKNGTTANGKQRYRCLRCGRQFIARYTYRGRDPSVRRLVVPLALKRLHRRTICFSKSPEMHEAVIRLYTEQHNRQHQI